MYPEEYSLACTPAEGRNLFEYFQGFTVIWRGHVSEKGVPDIVETPARRQTDEAVKFFRLNNDTLEAWWRNV